MDKKEKKYTFRKIFIYLVVILLLCILYSRYVETRSLIVKEYKVESEDIPTNFSGIKIIHLSDIYYKNTTFETDLEKIKNKINKLKPDIIVFTGNLYSLNTKMSDKDKSILIKFLSELTASTGKYAVKGQNDYLIDYENILKESDFTLLDNSYELIYNNGLTPIFIAGVPSISKDVVNTKKLFEYYENEETLKEAKYKIVLANEGNAFETIIQSNNTVNLMLGGSSLNGSINIPFYGPLYLPKNTTKYYAPHYKIENSELFISSGIGTNNIKFRFNNIPSFNLYRLKSI